MTDSRHPRALLSLALALVGVWATMVTVTEASATPAMHCHSVPMPCCPVDSAGGAHCMASQCFVQMPQKAETGVRTLVAPAAEAGLTVVPEQFSAPRAVLLRGGRVWPEVFRLKDDLRI